MLKSLFSFFIKYSPFIFLSLGICLVVLTYYQSFLAELSYNYDLAIGRIYKVNSERNLSNIKNDNNFHNIASNFNAKIIDPVNTDFSIVIEKLDVNAPVIKDVPVIDKDSYMKALKKGVAHASFSGYPDGENASVYLFAHSSNNFWELGKYSSVFNLLYKLNPKDEINIFYKDRRYVYSVDNKILINDFKVDETVYETIGPTLTLQTCYPTGTSLYRLVIRASLIGVYDYLKK